MSDDNDIRHGRHCTFLMHVHLVFVTKFRREVFTREILDDLRCTFASVCADFEAELVEFDGEDGHAHLLVNYPPKVSVSALVNSLKGVSSRVIRKKNYPSIRRKRGWPFGTRGLQAFASVGRVRRPLRVGKCLSVMQRGSSLERGYRLLWPVVRACAMTMRISCPAWQSAFQIR
jgi:putative transposase